MRPAAVADPAVSPAEIASAETSSNKTPSTETPVARAPGTLLGRVWRAVSALSLGAVASALGQIVIVPVAMVAWGQARYGEWVVVTGFITFLRLSDLGLQTYVVNRLSTEYARGSHDGVRDVLHSALRVLAVLFAVLMVGVAVVVPLLPMQRVLGVRMVGGTLLDLTLVLLALEFLVGVPMGVVGGVYRATGHLARAANIGTVQQLSLTAMTVGVIAARASFAAVAAARVGVALAVAAFMVWDLRRLHGWLGLRPTAGSWKEGAAMLVPGLFFLVFPVADYLNQQMTLLIVQQHLSGAEVSRLATHRTVVNLAQLACNMLIASVWYELNALHAREEHDRLSRMLRLLVTLNIWVAGAVAVGMLPFIGWLYPGWTAGRLSLSWLTLGLLCAQVVGWSIWYSCLTMLVSTNHHRQAAFVLLADAGLTCLGALLLVPRMGIAGAVLASLAGDALLPLWLIPRMAARHAGMRPGRLLADAAAALARGIVLPAAIGGAAWFLLPHAALRYGVVLPATAALALWLMWGHIAAREPAALAALAGGRLRALARGSSRKTTDS